MLCPLHALWHYLTLALSFHTFTGQVVLIHLQPAVFNISETGWKKQRKLFFPSLQSSQQGSILLDRIVHLAQHLAHCLIQIHFFHFITEVKYGCGLDLTRPVSTS